jgi:lysophospholipase L1-like esterase
MMTPRPWGRATIPLAALVIGALVAVSLSVIQRAAYAADVPLDQTTLITNNLQGQSSDGDAASKWTTSVFEFIRQAPIVLLQEVGPGGPPSAGDGIRRQTPEGIAYTQYGWRPGSSTRGSQYNVYYAQTQGDAANTPNGRVNIAVVTRDVPDEVRIVTNPVAAGRAALGVRFGTHWYFTVHGLSGGGGDDGPLLTQIDQRVRAWTGASAQWTAAGDFNVDPATLRARATFPQNAVIRSTGRATHINGGELDYIVTSETNYLVQPELRHGATPDHFAVQLGPIRANAEATPVPKVKIEPMISYPKPLVDEPTPPFIDKLVKAESTILLALLAVVSVVLKRDNPVEFVGSQSTGSGLNYSGVPGENVSQLGKRSESDLPTYRPNVVPLIQAGINDVLNGEQDAVPDRLSALVDQIQTILPGTVVVLSTLTPATDPTIQGRITKVNSAIRTLVDNEQNAGRKVVLADMRDVTTSDLATDGLSPNDAGATKMAAAVESAIGDALLREWVTDPTSTSQLNGSTCDIYTYYGTPCVGAYSMTRAMYSNYPGPLYQVQRATDGATADIGLQSSGGKVKASDQDSFCANTACTVTRLYDQSPRKNDLTIAPGGGAAPGADKGADAAALPITIGGDKAYGLDITPGTGYRNNNTWGVAVGDQPEGMYMVASGTNVNNGCCYDFGNAETNTQDTGDGHMDAVNLSTTCFFGSGCTGGGPWVQADLENGLFNGGTDGKNSANQGNNSNFVTALLKNNGRTKYALRGGDSQSGGLSTWWNGGLPTIRPGYIPMKKEGAILLGVGGDNSNWSQGSFFEGVMTAGYPSDTADNAVQANIVAAKYGGKSGGTTTAPTPAGPAVTHDGYSSVYTVNSANGHLQETYLPKMGDPWSTQDLSAKYGTPAVLAGTKPISVTHDGYVSVYTVDANNGHVQETYLPKMGDPWSTQDLSAKYGTPATSWTPTAVVHDGYTSVWTVNSANGHLQETYLPKMGDPWSTQDLSAKYGTPSVAPGTQPVAFVHTGYTSVYTIDQASMHLRETYLPAMGDPWSTQDLSAKYGTVPTNDSPIVLLHPNESGSVTWSSVFTVDQASLHLRETYLPAMGDPWSTQDLSAKYGTPAATAAYTASSSGWSVVHDGYASTFTVRASDGHLFETYLSAMGQPWVTQDLNQYGSPAVMKGTSPTAVTHDGYTSVYTVATDGHLWETYLSAMGQPWHAQDLTVLGGAPTSGLTPSALYHGGYTSVYTVSGDGHLWETYLTGIGATWVSQDLHQKYQTPIVLQTASPVAVLHSGWVSVFTISLDSVHLDETYLPAIGGPWITQDLNKYGSPPDAVTPAVLVHDGYISVYTVNNGDLWETYLPAIGDDWTAQDLSQKYHTPAVDASSPPLAVDHGGYASVYTIDSGSNDLQETYLPAMSDDWGTQDLSGVYKTPAVKTNWGTLNGGPRSMSVLVHYDTSGALTWTSVFSIDRSSGDLDETYLPAVGQPWGTQDLSNKYRTPTS